MDSNVYSTEPPVGLAALESVVEALAARDLTRLTDGQAAARVLALRGLLERLEGQWLRELANVDGRGAAGAEDGIQAASTAGWLRGRLAVRDGGCSFPNCDRPLAWCEAHHLRHWLHGGPTDLANLALLCRHLSSCRARGRLADPPSSRWGPHRGATASKTGARGVSRDG